MNRLKIISSVAFILLLLILTSCSAIFSTFYGLHSLKPVTSEGIEKYAKKYEIPLSDLFFMDTSYLSFLKTIDTSQNIQVKNHSQLLQVLYFDNAGNLISYHVNCYAGGFPNLKWNRNGILETFVPQSQTPIDTLLNFHRQFQFLRTLSKEKPDISIYNTDDYNVVVYWNIFMGRQSKRLIKCVKDNCNLAKNKSLKIMFVNTDELFVQKDD